jgi:hypothetical protein
MRYQSVGLAVLGEAVEQEVEEIPAITAHHREALAEQVSSSFKFWRKADADLQGF